MYFMPNREDSFISERGFAFPVTNFIEANIQAEHLAKIYGPGKPVSIDSTAGFYCGHLNHGEIRSASEILAYMIFNFPHTDDEMNFC